MAHQVIEFRDQSTPSKRAKPAGVTGAEVWCKVGPPAPLEGTGCTFLGLDTRTPYLAEFDPADSGKAVWYVLRWVSTTGQPGCSRRWCRRETGTTVTAGTRGSRILSRVRPALVPGIHFFKVSNGD